MRTSARVLLCGPTLGNTFHVRDVVLTFIPAYFDDNDDGFVNSRTDGRAGLSQILTHIDDQQTGLLRPESSSGRHWE